MVKLSERYNTDLPAELCEEYTLVAVKLFEALPDVLLPGLSSTTRLSGSSLVFFTSPPEPLVGNGTDETFNLPAIVGELAVASNLARRRPISV